MNPQPALDVAHMTVPEKLGESITRSLPKLPQDARAVAASMVSPEALRVIAVTTAFWAGSHFFGVGEIADLILLLAGYVMVGKSALEASEALLEFAVTATRAKSDQELNTAADYFAKAVLLAGITAVSALLLGKTGGKPKPATPAVADAVEEGTLYARTAAKLNMQVIKQLIIDAWKQPGKWPVKVLKLRAGQQVGDAVAAGGYITTENAIAGAWLRELERRLGLAAGSLGDGAVVVRLDRLPAAGEFEPRFYNNVHGGGVLPPNPNYPLGPGFPQWEIGEGISISAVISKIVR